MGDATGGRRKSHTEELYNLFFSPNIIRTIKSGQMRLERYIARRRENKNYYVVFIEQPEAKKNPL
jgi:hypothetical protein